MEVVGAAVIRGAHVLAARRVGPTGGWEFPGGKVEPGESPAEAIQRECREELGVAVRAVAPIGTAADQRIVLQVWHVELLAGTPTPLQDHDELRWLTAEQLGTLGWLALDHQVLGAVVALLRGS